MDMANASDSTRYQFPQPWVVLLFLFGIGGLSLLATITPGHASGSNPPAPPAHVAAPSSGAGEDNSRECDLGRGIDSDCIFP